MVSQRQTEAHNTRHTQNRQSQQKIDENKRESYIARLKTNYNKKKPMGLRLNPLKTSFLAVVQV